MRTITMSTKKTIRTYSELKRLRTHRERYEYLKLDGIPGSSTFGNERYINQTFYKSAEWKSLRRQIILRDCGCDLGVEGYEIHGKIIIHHMNPLRPEDILEHSIYTMNPEYLICVSIDTHNAIHYGDVNRILPNEFISRQPNDTCPWKRS